MAKKTVQPQADAQVTTQVDPAAPADAETTTNDTTASESLGDNDSATNDAPATEPPADAPEATTDDPLVPVAWHDGSTFTFDLHVFGHRVAFIDGVARVPQALADDLRTKGYVK